MKYTGIMSHDSFRADYSVASNIATMRKVYSYSITAILGSYSDASLTRPRVTQSGSLPAIGRLQYKVTYGVGVEITTTFWTEIHALGHTATADFGG